MRTAGAVFVAVAVLIAGYFWLVPQDVSVIGSTLSCGAPIANTSAGRSSVSDVDASVLSQCEHENRSQVFTGLILGVIALVSGLVMLSTADRQETSALVASGAVIEAVHRPLWRSLLRKLSMLVALLVIGSALVAVLAM